MRQIQECRARPDKPVRLFGQRRPVDSVNPVGKRKIEREEMRRERIKEKKDRRSGEVKRQIPLQMHFSVPYNNCCRRCRPIGRGFLLLFLRHSRIHASASTTETRVLLETTIRQLKL